MEKGTRVRSLTEIIMRHTDTLRIKRHTDTLMIQRWMSTGVTMKATNNREILGQTDIAVRHTDTQEMTR